MSNERQRSHTPLSSVHQPVLLKEVLSYLDLQVGQTVVDGTVGAAGHSRHLIKQIGQSGLLIGLDRDPMMLKFATSILNEPNVQLRQASYLELPEVLAELKLKGVDRILLDLGLSSDQLIDPQRGFGFDQAAPLDMRFDLSSGVPAWKLIEQATEDELQSIMTEFGEERFSKEIAKQIVSQRRHQPIRTTQDLVDVIQKAIPQHFLRSAKKNPATRVFQAFRIATNQELKHLKQSLETSLYQALNPGGRAVVISFHSLEDRIVKQAFRGKEQWQNLTPKPISSSTVEQKVNPRARSAKLRAAVKI